MFEELKNRISGLENRLSEIRSEENDLEHREGIDREYIKDLQNGFDEEELRKAVNLWIEEVNEAEDLTGKIEQAEGDILDLENIISDTGFSTSIASRLKDDTVHLSNFIEEFEVELQKIKDDGKYLRGFLNRVNNSELSKKFNEAFSILSGVNSEISDVDRGIRVSRRGFVKATGVSLTSGTVAGCIGDEEESEDKIYFPECEEGLNKEKTTEKLTEILISGGRDHLTHVTLHVETDKSSEEFAEYLENNYDLIVLRSQITENRNWVRLRGDRCTLSSLSNREFTELIREIPEETLD